MRLSRPSRWVTLSRVSQSPIPAGLRAPARRQVAGSTGGAIRCHRHLYPGRNRRLRKCHGVHDRPLRDRHGQASTRRSCRSERMSNNGVRRSHCRASFLATRHLEARSAAVELLLAALERHSRDGPLKPTGESSPSSLFTPLGAGFSAAAPWAADKRPSRRYWRPRDYPSIEHQSTLRMSCLPLPAATTANRTAQATAHPMLYAV